MTSRPPPRAALQGHPVTSDRRNSPARCAGPSGHLISTKSPSQPPPLQSPLSTAEPTLADPKPKPGTNSANIASCARTATQSTPLVPASPAIRPYRSRIARPSRPGRRLAHRARTRRRPVSVIRKRTANDPTRRFRKCRRSGCRPYPASLRGIRHVRRSPSSSRRQAGIDGRSCWWRGTCTAERG